ncbi:MAG: sulfotransferase [Myxococcales bacterium]|nr:sulfotransferase [Myxococcales bacterium]
MIEVWHQATDSDRFRRVVKSDLGRRVLDSTVWESIDLERNRILMKRAHKLSPDLFNDVRTFCLFVGHNKSGTSMLGALLDAHPRVIVSDEVHALRYVAGRFDRNQLFHRLYKGSRSEARKGRVTARRLDPYSYEVEGQWQGNVDAPLAVGDGKAGTTTRLLGQNPRLLDDARALMAGIDVKLIQVIRNPFDPISVMMVRGGRTFRNAVDHYFAACSTLLSIRRSQPAGALHSVRYEDFVADPAHGLMALCEHLAVPIDAEHIERCAAIIRPAPDRSRDMVAWDERWISEVESRIADVDFLGGYSYDC